MFGSWPLARWRPARGSLIRDPSRLCAQGGQRAKSVVLFGTVDCMLNEPGQSKGSRVCSLACPLRSSRQSWERRLRVVVFGVGLHAFHHDNEQHAALIPSTEPTHGPAIDLITYHHRTARPQELRFHSHNALRTCMPPYGATSEYRMNFCERI